MSEQALLCEKAVHPVAKPIVPTAKQSGPLTHIDLATDCAHPVYAENIDLISAGQGYLLARQGEDPKLLPPLQDAVLSAATGTLRRDIRILIDYDTDVHTKLGFPKFEKYYEHLTGQKISHSTVWRRRLRAEFALLLGARNRPDLLPSQRQCELIRKELTRDHGIRFLLGFESSTHLHRMGEVRLLDRIATYRAQNDLPSVGERVDLVKDVAGTHSSLQEPADDDVDFLRKIVEILAETNPVSVPAPQTAAARIFVAMGSAIAQPPKLPSEKVARIVNLIRNNRRDEMEELIWVTLADLVTTAIFGNGGTSVVPRVEQAHAI